MKRKIGTVLMSVGTAFVLAALSLFIYNQYTAVSAEKASQELLPKLIEQVNQSSQDQIPFNNDVVDMSMKEVSIEGEDYIGYLTIPTLNLELPVIADWNYEKLKTAPCRFSGTEAENNLVIMAHNYTCHFGSLKNLLPGDKVYFRNAYGHITEYTVAVTDVLSQNAVEEMTAGDYDLTLFTCTYSGTSRVTVRCDKA